LIMRHLHGLFIREKRWVCQAAGNFQKPKLAV
jgi:hypothetical protein